MLVSNPFLSTVYQFGQAVMQDYWMTFLKFKSDVRVLSSMLPSRLEPYRYFTNLNGYLLTRSVLKDVYFCLKKILDGRAPDYLTEKLLSLKYCKSHNTRSRMPYRLPIPQTNNRKRMFFFNALQLWKNISDYDFVYSTNLKKFRRNYFDHIMCKFTPDSFKTIRIY